MMEHDVWIPALHRDLTNGTETVKVAGATVGEVVTELDQRFPGIKDRLCEEGKLRPYIAVSVNGEVSHRGLRERLTEQSDIHFIPALSGG
ncbi:MAG: MoaD/ThiS family protein [Caldilineaceae bacterium]|nr:MoaD/ThiS family protein [Caldilineaceae bacterium]